MKVLGISISGKGIYIVQFTIGSKVNIKTDKFELANDSGESLRILYNFFEIYLKQLETVDLIVLETVQLGQRTPSLERVKAEGIIDMVIFDLNLQMNLIKIKTQKNKKKYKGLILTDKWNEYKTMKYFGKLDQIYAFLMLEGKL